MADLANAVWKHAPTPWTLEETLPGALKTGSVHPRAFGIDNAGCLHVARLDHTVNPLAVAYGRRSGGSWTLGAALGHVHSLPPQILLAFSESGAPYIVWQGPAGNDLTIYVSDTQSTQSIAPTIAPVGSGGPSAGHNPADLAVTTDTVAGKDRIHLFYPEAYELKYATALAGENWTHTTVAAANPAAPVSCPKWWDVPAPKQGDKCSYDNTVQYPVAMVASGNGEVRMFYYARRNQASNLVYTCTGPDPASDCHWAGPVALTVSLKIAWPNGSGGFDSANLVTNVNPTTNRGDAALDHTGATHLVFVDRDTSGEPFVRHLRIGPAGP